MSDHGLSKFGVCPTLIPQLTVTPTFCVFLLFVLIIIPLFPEISVVNSCVESRDSVVPLNTNDPWPETIALFPIAIVLLVVIFT